VESSVRDVLSLVKYAYDVAPSGRPSVQRAAALAAGLAATLAAHLAAMREAGLLQAAAQLLAKVCGHPHLTICRVQHFIFASTLDQSIDVVMA